MLDLVLSWAEPALVAATAVLVGLVTALVRRAPRIARAFLENLKMEAEKTPTPADDAAVRVILAIVDSLEKALADKPRASVRPASRKDGAS